MYIDQLDGKIEDFLRRNGIFIARMKWESVPVGHLPVIHINNGILPNFGIIANSEAELKAIIMNDERHKKIFLVETEKLMVASSQFRIYAKNAMAS